MLKIPTSARIAWNTYDDKTVQRDDQESIFLATFAEPFSGKLHKFQIDYSYYNRGKYADNPKFVLEVYACGDEDFDTDHYFVKHYKMMDEAENDINHWLQVFHDKVSEDVETEKPKKVEKPSISTISLHLTFKKDTPQYVLDFFTKGIKDERLPSVLYSYDFKFNNKPNFSGKTTLFCEKKKGRYYLNIYHKFDFHTEATEAYWFVGGLCQYAEDDAIAGYVNNTFDNASSQIFGFRDGLCFWKGDVNINYHWTRYHKPDLTVREMTQQETPFLETMLHQAIFTPKGDTPPEKSIIFEPYLHHYIKDFGQKHDICLVATLKGKLLGAIWSRLFSTEEKGYGFIDSETPEISMAVNAPYRGSGVGSILLNDLLAILKNKGYKQAALSVDLRNYAFGFYQKMGFEAVEIKGNSVKMVYKF
jgi:GNAT superfamily N-acetyltransferase